MFVLLNQSGDAHWGVLYTRARTCALVQQNAVKRSQAFLTRVFGFLPLLSCSQVAKAERVLGDAEFSGRAEADLRVEMQFSSILVCFFFCVYVLFLIYISASCKTVESSQNL